MPTLLDSYSETNQDAVQNIDGHDPGGNNGMGQAFIGDGNKLDSAKFYIQKVGSPTGNCTAKLYAETHSVGFGTDSNVTGAAIETSANVDVAALSTSLTLVTFTFAGTTVLTNTTPYFMVFNFGGGSSGNAVGLGYDNSSPTDDGNAARFSNTISTWAAVATADVCFYVYTVTTLPVLVPGQQTSFRNSEKVVAY